MADDRSANNAPADQNSSKEELLNRLVDKLRQYDEATLRQLETLYPSDVSTAEHQTERQNERENKRETETEEKKERESSMQGVLGIRRL